MASIEQYSGDILPHVMLSTAGTAGDLMIKSTGSAATYKSGDGTANSKSFIGVLVNNTAAGSYGAVKCNGVVQLQKHAATQVIEIGDRIAGTKSSNLVGTILKGTAIGICAVQSGSTDTYVSVRLLPFFEAGVNGFVA